jgi:hypothetical protein
MPMEASVCISSDQDLANQHWWLAVDYFQYANVFQLVNHACVQSLHSCVMHTLMPEAANDMHVWFT